MSNREEIIATSKKDLKKIIKNEINKHGNNADLNHINISKLTDLSFLFKKSEFNGDISNWDVSMVKDMYYMFDKSQFNGDISNWDVKNVKDMQSMFAKSQFNGDISNWDVSTVKDMCCMFDKSQFNGDISSWNLSDKCKSQLKDFIKKQEKNKFNNLTGINIKILNYYLLATFSHSQPDLTITINDTKYVLKQVFKDALNFNANYESEHFYELPPGKYNITISVEKFKVLFTYESISSQEIQVEVKPNSKALINYKINALQKSSIRFDKYVINKTDN